MPPEFDREKLFRGDDKTSLSAAEEFDKRMAELVEQAEAKLPRKMRDGVLDPNGYYPGTRRDEVEAAEHGPIIKDGLANQPFGEQRSGLTVTPAAAPVVAGPPDPELRQQAMDRMGVASKRLAELQRTDPSICRSYRPGQAPPKSSAVMEVEQELRDSMRQFIAADPTYPGLSRIKASLDDMQRRQDDEDERAFSASTAKPAVAPVRVTPEMLAASAKFGVFASILEDIAAEQDAGDATAVPAARAAPTRITPEMLAASAKFGVFGSILEDIAAEQAVAAASMTPDSARGADAIADLVAARPSTTDLLPGGKDETSGLDQLQAILRSGDQPRVSAVSSLLADFPAERAAMMETMRGHVGPKFIASLVRMGGSTTTALAAPTSVTARLGTFNDAMSAQRGHQSPAASDPQQPVMLPSKPRNVSLTAPVQMKADVADSAMSAADVREAAALGTVGSGHTLPFIDQLQKAFGRDLTGIKAHTDSSAAAGAAAMGAKAYATGNHVVFDENPDLHTVAHEVAHVLQQQEGVHLSSGIGAAGDDYERAADAIADRVVTGQSAADLLPGAQSASPGVKQLQSMLRAGDQPNVSAVSSLLADFPAEREAMMAELRGSVSAKFVASLAKVRGDSGLAAAPPPVPQVAPMPVMAPVVARSSIDSSAVQKKESGAPATGTTAAPPLQPKDLPIEIESELGALLLKAIITREDGVTATGTQTGTRNVAGQNVDGKTQENEVKAVLSKKAISLQDTLLAAEASSVSFFDITVSIGIEAFEVSLPIDYSLVKLKVAGAREVQWFRAFLPNKKVVVEISGEIALNQALIAKLIVELAPFEAAAKKFDKLGKATAKAAQKLVAAKEKLDAANAARDVAKQAKQAADNAQNAARQAERAAAQAERTAATAEAKAAAKAERVAANAAKDAALGKIDDAEKLRKTAAKVAKAEEVAFNQRKRAFVALEAQLKTAADVMHAEKGKIRHRIAKRIAGQVGKVLATKTAQTLLKFVPVIGTLMLIHDAYDVAKWLLSLSWDGGSNFGPKGEGEGDAGGRSNGADAGDQDVTADAASKADAKADGGAPPKPASTAADAQPVPAAKEAKPDGGTGGGSGGGVGSGVGSGREGTETGQSAGTETTPGAKSGDAAPADDVSAKPEDTKSGVADDKADKATGDNANRETASPKPSAEQVKAATLKAERTAKTKAATLKAERTAKTKAETAARAKADDAAADRRLFWGNDKDILNMVFMAGNTLQVDQAKVDAQPAKTQNRRASNGDEVALVRMRMTIGKHMGSRIAIHVGYVAQRQQGGQWLSFTQEVQTVLYNIPDGKLLVGIDMHAALFDSGVLQVKNGQVVKTRETFTMQGLATFRILDAIPEDKGDHWSVAVTLKPIDVFDDNATLRVDSGEWVRLGGTKAQRNELIMTLKHLKTDH